MTIVDANYILRAVVKPVTAADEQMAEIAKNLFADVANGSEEMLLTDAVIAEVVFVLASTRHYNLGRTDVVARFLPFIQLKGCRVNRKQLVVAALDLWARTPKISFVNALGAIYAIEMGQTLASFDAQLAQVPGVTLWHEHAVADSG